MVASGAREIFLLGQNVNNYGRRFSLEHSKINFTQLLREISKIKELRRIRFTSPHPFHMDDEFLQEFAKNPKICKSMHIPLQSGSSRILKQMKRGYTKEWFLNRVDKLKMMIPDVSISTDIIVAFPGENNEDFENTLDVMRKVEFDQIFSFKYSPRPLTEAATFLDVVDSELGSVRLTMLQDLHNEILDKNVTKLLNQIHEVYFEELRADGYVVGRSDNNHLIKVKASEELLGEFKNVKIIQVNRLSSIGEIVS